MLELALKFSGGPAQISDIAKSQKIPIRFLEQILLLLKRRGLVSSVRGKEGGYSLVRHPSEVSVLEIIEALEGQVELTSRKMKKAAVVFEVFSKIEEDIRKELLDTTLEDLIFRKRQKERAYIYNI
jgi:Rrf2 family protein